MTWQRFMEAAHQGIDLRPIPLHRRSDPRAGLDRPSRSPEGEEAPQIARPSLINNNTPASCPTSSSSCRALRPALPEKFAATGAGEPAPSVSR